jgi:hypothetical protein
MKYIQPSRKSQPISVHDVETLEPSRIRLPGHFHVPDRRVRISRAQAVDEGFNQTPRTFSANFNFPGRKVFHPAGQMKAPRVPENEKPVSDALNHPGNEYAGLNVHQVSSGCNDMV